MACMIFWLVRPFSEQQLSPSVHPSEIFISENRCTVSLSVCVPWSPEADFVLFRLSSISNTTGLLAVDTRAQRIHRYFNPILIEVISFSHSFFLVISLYLFSYFSLLQHNSSWLVAFLWHQLLPYPLDFGTTRNNDVKFLLCSREPISEFLILSAGLITTTRLLTTIAEGPAVIGPSTQVCRCLVQFTLAYN